MSIFVSAVGTLGGSQAWAGQQQSAGSDLAKNIGTAGVMMAVMDADLAKKFATPCGTGAAKYCAMAAACVVQTGLMLAFSGGAGDTAVNMGSGDCPGCGATDPNGGFDPGKLATINSNITDAKKKLETKGYSIAKDNKSFTTPDGKSHGIGALASGEAMLQEGLIGPEDVALVNKEMNDMNSKMKAALNNASGAGGGGYTAPTKSDFKYDSTDPYAALYGQKPGDPKTKGLTRTLASGESIGSQTDNIFEMVSRCYERKNSQKIFYQPQGH